MAFNHAISLSHTITSNKSAAELELFLAEPEHMQRCMPKLNKLDILEDSQYQIHYHPMGPEGYQFEFSLHTQVQREAGSIAFVPVDNKAMNAQINGQWQLSDQSVGTEAQFAIDVELKVPVSRMLKPVAVPIINKIFARLIEQYAQNVQQQCA